MPMKKGEKTIKVKINFSFNKLFCIDDIKLDTARNAANGSKKKCC